MGNILGEQKPLKDVIRENQRALKKAIRELDREIKNQQNNEKKCVDEVKKLAKKGQMGAAKIVCKDVVRTKLFIKRFIEMKANLSAVSLQLQTTKSHAAMAEALKGVAKAMTLLNKQVPLPALQKIMTDFMRENERAAINQEMMGDVIEGAMEDEGSAAEEEAMINQVMGELLLEQTDAIPDVPMQSPINTGELSQSESTKDPAMMELEARLSNLKRVDENKK